MDSTKAFEHIPDERLFGYAAALAALERPEGSVSPRAEKSRLRQGLRELFAAEELIRRRFAPLSQVPAELEWVMDNGYLVRSLGRGALDALSQRGGLREVKGQALILALCGSLVQSGGGAVNAERCREFLDGYQSVTPLRRRELYAFPQMLSAAVILRLSQVCAAMLSAADTSVYRDEIAALYTSLGFLARSDMEKLLSAADVTGAILAADPSGDYGRMSPRTRQDYLRQIERLAKKEGTEEHILAGRLVARAKSKGVHVGFLLFKEPRKRRQGLYIGANVLLTGFFTLLPALAADMPLTALLLLLPVSELVKSLIDYILLHIVPPRPLPDMDMEKGVPAEGKTICVISALLDGSDPTARLERLYHACRREGDNLAFGLLADLPGGTERELPSDKALLHAARSAVLKLNERYGGGFYLFTRGRQFDGEGYTPFERKRGAIMALAALLRGEDSELTVVGDREALTGTNYILTLDSDTEVFPGSVGRLIGAALHPLNRPIIDPAKRRVVSGHGIIHPKISTLLSSSNATDFALIFAGAGGSDPYGGLCGELYMDCFGCGGFAGKGLISVDALLKCTRDRFPKGLVLSHDSLEGAYLRGGYMSDTEFSDSFPTSPISWYKRLHRWIRGDWQNLRWVFSRELEPIDRWRLFDCLRRSLVPPMTFLALVFALLLPARGLTAAAVVAGAALLSRLLLTLAEYAAERPGSLPKRRYNRLLTGVGGAMVSTFIRLWLLPTEAFVCLSAILLALWRMGVSRRRLLQWQTAAQSEGQGSSLWANLRFMWFSLLVGGLLLMLPDAPVIGRSVGLLWLLSPIAAAALALPAARLNPLSSADREYLIKTAGESFAFLLSIATREDNYLPPDNKQLSPPMGIAHRTSPTNIGLFAAAGVGAVDMGLCSREDYILYMERLISALERMEKYRGHPYNWYDTRTLAPLRPLFISTVDSGNMYAGLLTAWEMLKELGAAETAERLKAILDGMDFSFLYDSERGLFHISYDTLACQGVGGLYDLMASEAMLTGYIAIAKGDVPVKHWGRLSRAQLQRDGYRGLASWTGTMFEYLMPMLFLPVQEGSLLSESSKFCLAAQRKRAPAGLPWGESESGFNSLDSSLCYRYKAHGVQALALKRGMDEEYVVAPYASYLALCVQPAQAVKNLRRLEDLGLKGREGFMEAIDFTDRRQGQAGGIVKSCMAHHTAMSVIAAANAVCGGAVQRRFMAQPAMAAYGLLLQERLPEGGVLLKSRARPAGEKSRSAPLPQWVCKGGQEDREERFTLLTNGLYSRCLSSNGKGEGRYGEFVPFERLEIRLRRGDRLIPLLPCDKPSEWELSTDHAEAAIQTQGLYARWCCFLSPEDCGEIHEINLRSQAGGEWSVMFSLRALLCRRKDYAAHRAYWDLGLEAEIRDNMLLLRRLRRGSCPELWLVVAASGDVQFTLAGAGELADTRSRDIAPVGLDRGDVQGLVRLKLQRGRESRLRLVICPALSREGAVQGAKRMLELPEKDAADLTAACALRLGMDGADIAAAMELIPCLRPAPSGGRTAKSDLWQYSLSGDLPILCGEGDGEGAVKLLRRFCLLRCCGMDSDLVLFTHSDGQYHRPGRDRLTALLTAAGLDGLIEAEGGVHFLPRDAERAVSRRAAYIAGEKPQAPELDPPTIRGGERAADSLPTFAFTDGGFEFSVCDSLPSRIWQNILTNGHLGLIAADCGVCAMWFENAREMPLIPAVDDIRAVSPAELLWTVEEGERVSLFAANDRRGCRLRFMPGLASWEKELKGGRVTTEVFIPTETQSRITLISGMEGRRLWWRIPLCLGGEGESLMVNVRDEGEYVTAENPAAPCRQGLVLLCSAPHRFSLLPDKRTVLCEISPAADCVLVCSMASLREATALLPTDAAKAWREETLGFWRERTGGLKLEFKDSTLPHYLNTWLPYQIIAARLWGRCSLYQKGGAMGFRDQLQDCINLMLLDSTLAREQILLCTRHQYAQGDVMHWWHSLPAGDRGLRSRCSDDLLWLVWALCQYVERSGDMDILRVETEYLSSPPLREDEHDRYEQAQWSGERGSILDHAIRAMDCALSRPLGAHGLPLFLGGDWNDGLDGIEGESLWLGQLMSICASRLSRLLRRLCLPSAAHYAIKGRELARACEGCFKGELFPRGFDSEGLLAQGGRIDLLPQAFAVFCEDMERKNARTAVTTAVNRLLRPSEGLIPLLDPPYETAPYPGYIGGYGRGFRENGGQYNHASVWLAYALCRLGESDRALNLLKCLLPIERDLKRYGGEPFVLAADLTTARGHEGECGWSWYTGSAGWAYRLIWEEMLGLKLRGGRLFIEPRLPKELRGCRITWKSPKGRVYHISMDEKGVEVDGEHYTGFALE